uniref:Uncharacterized protein n=1 Tax=Kwoniella bestiolae CBS 10118 TaxID=1296100 RepID=A0A1B9G0N0_9TREE|nr:hypothetical protein I302_06027 [Kwoniella bestiolae CBS 10118]OCF24566.1 hypothetical protein I302_06027 [Kwoniella bestiolae CBS 10118]
MRFNFFSIKTRDSPASESDTIKSPGECAKVSKVVLRIRGGCCSGRGIEWGDQGNYSSRGRSSRSRSGNCGGGGGGGGSSGDGGGGDGGGGGGGGGGAAEEGTVVDRKIRRERISYLTFSPYELSSD